MFGNPDGSRAMGITILSTSQKVELEREFRKDSRLGSWEKGELAVRIGGSRNDVPLVHLWFIVRRRVERHHAPKGLLSRRDDAIRVLRSLIRTPETTRELDLQLLNERHGKELVHPLANQTRKTSSSSPTPSVFSSAWSKLGAASKPSRSASLAHDLTATRFNLPRLSKPRRVSNGIIHVHNSVITSIPNDLPQTVLPPDAEQRPRKSSLKGDAEIPSLAHMMKADITDVRKFSAENSKPAKESEAFISLEQPQIRRCSTDPADKRLSVATTVNSPELESMYAFHKKGRRRSPHLHEIVSQHVAQKARPEVQVASVMLPAQTQTQPLIPGSDLPAPLHKLHLERMASMSSHMEHAMKRDKRTGADQKTQRLSLEIPGANGERRKSIEKVHDWMANNAGDEFMSLGPAFTKQEPTRHYSIHSNMSSRTLTDSTRGSILFDEGYHSRGSWSTDHTMPFQEAVLTMLQKPTHPLATSEIPSPLEQTGANHIFNAQKEKSFNFIVPLMESPQLNHRNICDKTESDSTLPEKLQRLPPLDLDKAKMERRNAAHEPMLSPKSPAPPLNEDDAGDNDEDDEDDCGCSIESETPDGSMYSLWSETSYEGLDLTAFLPKLVLDQITESFLKSFEVYKLRNGIQGCQMTPGSSSPCPTQGQQSSKGGKKNCGKKSNERKRKRGNDEDGDQDERRRRFDAHRSESDAEDGKNERSFACPYCKWKPVTYGDCRMCVLKEISRVKQHLFRKHVGPFQCVHCYAEFKTSELRDAHLLQRSCTTVPRRTMEYMTEDMRHRIKKRVDPKKTKREQWYEIYAILFPDDPLPKDPYLDEVISTELDALQAFAREEFPQLAETIISEQLPPPLRHQEQVLRSFLPYLIEQGFQSLLRRFEEQRGPRPDAPQTGGLIAEHSPSLGPASDSGISTTPPQGSFNRLGDSWSMANLQTPPVTTPGSTSTVNWHGHGHNRSFVGRVQARAAASSVDLPWQPVSQGGSQNLNAMGGSPMENPWSFQESTSSGIGSVQGMFQDTSMTDPSNLQQHDLHISNQGTDILSVNMDAGTSSFQYSFNDPGQGLTGNGNGHGNGGQFFGHHGFGGMN